MLPTRTSVLDDRADFGADCFVFCVRFPIVVLDMFVLESRYAGAVTVETAAVPTGAKAARLSFLAISLFVIDWSVDSSHAATAATVEIWACCSTSRNRSSFVSSRSVSKAFVSAGVGGIKHAALALPLPVIVAKSIMKNNTVLQCKLRRTCHHSPFWRGHLNRGCDGVAAGEA